MAQKIPFGSKCYLAHTLLPKTSKAGNNLGQPPLIKILENS